MKREMFRCACCGRYLPRDPRIKNQRFCGCKKCQQYRKNEWQRKKMACDPDYQANKKESQLAWQGKNKDYWKRYRRNHPVYVFINRQKQKERENKQRLQSCQDVSAPSADLAKKDALNSLFNDNSISYFLTPTAGSLAKKDAIIVKVVPISTG